jgi:epsin
MSLGPSASSNKATAAGATANKSIKDLEKEKAQAGIWGSGLQSQQQQQRPVGGAIGAPGAFGNFSSGSFTTPSSASAGGGDDLLL